MFKTAILKKQILFLVAIVGLSTLSFGQEEEFFSAEGKKTEKEKRKIERWSFGGNFGLSFGSSRSYVQLSPAAIYQATPRLYLGPGFTYLYYKQQLNDETVSSSIYGPRAIASFVVLKDINEVINFNIGNIILQSEYEFLNLEVYDLKLNSRRVWNSSLLVGAGIMQPIGRKGGFRFSVLFNLLEDEFRLYSNPIVRFGLYF